MVDVSGSVDDRLWGDHLFELMPARMQQGYAGAFFTFTPAMICNTIELLSNNALHARHLNHDESPDDILTTIGLESGIVQYFSESNDSFRTRILDKWNTVPYYGRENTLTGALYSVGNSNFSSVTLDFNLAGTDVAIGPTTPSGSTIQPYPPSTQNVFQFNVYIEITDITANPSDVESRLIPDKQLNNIRRIIKLMKPVDYACREIMIKWVSPTISGYYLYDVPNPYVTWDNGSIVWKDSSYYTSADYILERHKP